MGIAMKKIIILFITITLLAACASVPTAQDEFSTKIQRSIIVFDSVNSKMFGEALRDRGTLTGFNHSQYKVLLTSFNSKRAKELLELLTEYDIQRLESYNNTFVFCIFSSKQGFAMCDDARCSGVERRGHFTSPAIFIAWLKELPLIDCPQH